MSRRQQTMRMLRIPALLGCATALALTGCAAGPGAHTAQQVAAVNGSNGGIGPIALRDTVLAYPGGEDVSGYRAGENAVLGVTIVNTSSTPDQLVSVTSPSARSVTVEGQTIIPGGGAVSSAGDATAAGSEAPGPAQSRQLRIVLTQLREPIRPGLNTPVTFRFQQAGAVTLPVPINAPVGVAPAPAPAEAGHHSG